MAAACIAGLAAGGAVRLADSSAAANAVWAAVAAVVLLPLSWSVLRSLVRGRFGVDVIALISIGGALALGEYLAASVIAVMLAGGNALEERARARARRELTSLVSRAPRTATLVHDDVLEEVPVDDVVPGDIVFVPAGAVLPVDGLLEGDEALIDESSLTGESLPVAYWRGETLRSGTVTSAPLRMRAVRKASESAYAALVRLVREAEEQRAPFVRLADRYAVVFLPVTATVAGLAWALSGDPVRALAVFVVATPCPLILAAPIALLSGVSRAARAGIVVKGGTVIERLGSARTVLLDKTGTITLGTPELASTQALDGFTEDDALRLAASLDQLSLHPFARALVREARARSLRLTFPERSTEHPGHGIEGTIEGHEVVVGSDSLLHTLGYDTPSIDAAEDEDHARALLGVDGATVAALEFADLPRREALDIVDRLHAHGIVHVALLTGDRSSVAESIGSQLRVDRVYAEQSPEAKLDVVRALQATPGMSPVVMVGDGINDAPALALADVGIAMGSVGATASSETADAVVLVDRVDRVVDAIAIGRRSLALARQSVVVGMGLSFAGMIAASLGLLAPVGGALLQEAIDVAVIANALRALR